MRNIVVVDGRRCLFDFKKQAFAISEIVNLSQGKLEQTFEVDQLIENLATNPISKETEYHFVFQSQNQLKLQGYRLLLESVAKQKTQALETLFRFCYFIDSSTQNSSKIIESIFQISQSRHTSIIGNKIIVTHNPITFYPNMDKGVQLFLFSSFLQNALTKKCVEEYYYKKNLVSYHVSSLAQISVAIPFIDAKKKEENAQLQTITVGYGFIKKKFVDNFQLKFLNLGYPVTYRPIDMRFPNDGSKIDLFFHQCIDFIKESEKQINVDLWNQCLENYYDFEQKRRGDVQFISDLKNFSFCQDRKLFQNFYIDVLKDPDFQTLMKNKYPSINLQVPLCWEISDPKSQQSLLQQGDFNFPVILKTSSACQTTNSHQMAIVLNFPALIEYLEKWDQSLFIQELVNHDGRINQIYFIGDRMNTLVKPSISNIDVTYAEKYGSVWQFNSQKPFHGQLPIPCETHLKDLNCDLQREVIFQLGILLSKSFLFDLFGYDIIQKSGTQDYYFIDINYFPGFKNLPGVEKDFERMIYRKFDENQKRLGQN